MSKDIKVAVVVIAILAATFAVSTVAESLATKASEGFMPAQADKIEIVQLDARKIEDLVNQERLKLGLSTLTHSEKLSQSACLKLDDMVAGNYWSHDAPDGTEPWDYIRQVGYTFVRAGENQAYNFFSEQSMVAGWMNSPTHRENITGDYAAHGVCAKVANFQNETTSVVVHHFATPN